MYLLVPILIHRSQDPQGPPAQPEVPHPHSPLFSALDGPTSWEMGDRGVVGTQEREETRGVRDSAQPHPAMRKMTRRGSVAMVKR